MYALLELVCTDIYVIDLLVASTGGLICTIVFLLLLVSYGVILHSLKNLSQEGRQNALQTRVSHITVVVCFFVSCIFMYVRPDRQWHLTPVLLPGKSHGWRSLVGYSLRGCKELDTTE